MSQVLATPNTDSPPKLHMPTCHKLHMPACHVRTSRGRVEVMPLEWGKEGYEQVAESLAQAPIDWVLAADCLYIDNVSTL
jgi:hypothetical protein